eukprot:Blabericola_migrator_1__7300@NODE_3712_length_1561_cov_33_702811_g78_i1_p2_GENE_NODE_3712_length_1561_cov_33_702811_g78_i1NODE_3712_length_1561_cov_33_702811_g78_i1_p2_ORF_typecomplete_len164_score29_03_NODE_3712_length_1561_cov_33_702811_g78_i18711362
MSLMISHVQSWFDQYAYGALGAGGTLKEALSLGHMADPSGALGDTSLASRISNILKARQKQCEGNGVSKAHQVEVQRRFDTLLRQSDKAPRFSQGRNIYAQGSTGLLGFGSAIARDPTLGLEPCTSDVGMDPTTTGDTSCADEGLLFSNNSFLKTPLHQMSFT